MDVSPPRPLSPAEQETQPPHERPSPSTSSQLKPTRSRKGCYSCRKRKVKCDETPPVCRNCKIGDRQVRTDNTPFVIIDCGTLTSSVTGRPSMKSRETKDEGRLRHRYQPILSITSPDSQSRLSTEMGSPTCSTCWRNETKSLSKLIVQNL